MKNIVFVVEKTKTGFSAFAEDENCPVATTGATVAELKQNMLEAANSFFEYRKKPMINPENITMKIDLPQFFDYYKEINAKAISKRVGMNETLLSQYVNGRKKPSQKQEQKIFNGIKSLGQELSALEFA